MEGQTVPREPEWVQRAMERRLPAKDMTVLPPGFGSQPSFSRTHATCDGFVGDGWGTCLKCGWYFEQHLEEPGR